MAREFFIKLLPFLFFEKKNLAIKQLKNFLIFTNTKEISKSDDV